jgi:hypothetical protein
MEMKQGYFCVTTFVDVLNVSQGILKQKNLKIRVENKIKKSNKHSPNGVATCDLLIGTEYISIHSIKRKNCL